MAQKIIIGNLPQDITIEEISKVLVDAGVEQPDVKLNNEGDASKVTAILGFSDLDRLGAQRIAEQIGGTRFRDRTLSAYVPLFL